MRKITSQIAAPAANTTQKESALPVVCSNRQSVRAAATHTGSNNKPMMNFSHLGTARGEIKSGAWKSEKFENQITK